MATGAVASFLCGVVLVFLSGLFSATASANSYWRPDLLARMGVTALFTPVGYALVESLTVKLADEDSGPRAQRLLRSARVP